MNRATSLLARGAVQIVDYVKGCLEHERLRNADLDHLCINTNDNVINE